MKVFVAAATGAMGRQLVPLLVAAGHEVVGMTRRRSNRARLEELGTASVVADWPPALARTLGGREPVRVPEDQGREFAAEAGVVMMTEARGASNARARRELGSARPSWRQGFATA